jgi:hypothetical protein
MENSDKTELARKAETPELVAITESAEPADKAEKADKTEKAEKIEFSEQEIAQYAELFLLAHRQLANIQKQLGPGMTGWERWRFRSRHGYIQQLLRKLLQQKGGDREEAEKAIEADMKYIGTGKKGWSYVSAGEIDYMEGLLKGA